MSEPSSSTLQNLSLRQLQVFEATARLLSFTKASHELHLSQPAVSMQIKELEESCQLPLFERSGRAIRLTEAGREMARCAQGVTHQLELAREHLDALRGLRAGMLKLGAVSTAKYFAPTLLAAFRRDNPGVSIQFSVGNRHEMIRQLRENLVDLMVMGRPPLGIDTQATPFLPHPLVIVAAPDHPLAKKRKIPLRALQTESFILREEGSGTRAAMQELFREAKCSYQASMEMSSNETIKQAVAAGMGVAFLSEHTAGLELATGRLVRLRVPETPVVRHWFVVHRVDKRLLPAARAFSAFLVQDGAALIAAQMRPPAPVKRPSRARLASAGRPANKGAGDQGPPSGPRKRHA